jgi:hypothetical protein
LLLSRLEGRGDGAWPKGGQNRGQAAGFAERLGVSVLRKAPLNDLPPLASSPIAVPLSNPARITVSMSSSVIPEYGWVELLDIFLAVLSIVVSSSNDACRQISASS